MATWLQQSTAVTVAVGPAVDETDGRTIETALTITPSDVRLRKAEGSWAAKNESTNASHTENGWYDVPLNSTDTGTLGSLIISINEAGALPMWREFLVVPTNVYLSFFGTDKLEVDMAQIAGSNVNVATAQLGVNVIQVAGQTQSVGDIIGRIGSPAGASMSADIAAIQSDTNDIQARLPAALTGGRLDATLSTTEHTTIADTFLKRDLSAVTGEAARSVLNALRFLRNKWSVAGSTLTVTKEDDTTTAWTATVTATAGADPITASDPA